MVPNGTGEEYSKTMTSKLRPIIGSVLFFAAMPGVIAGWIPYALSAWRKQDALLGLSATRALGAVLLLIGLAGLIECFARFAIQGHGTPAPVAPTDRLVVTGLYRHVRNPMYLAVVSIIVGQGLVLGSLLLLAYAAAVWSVCHLFILIYEEPTLRRQFGESYAVYESQVRRWLPGRPAVQEDST